MQIIISDKAAEEIVKQSAEKGHRPSVRIGLRGGGCTGFSYLIEWNEEPKETDLSFSLNGAEVVIDPKSIIYLDGSTLDFEVSIMGRGFRIDSPLAKGVCGCGESVQF